MKLKCFHLFLAGILISGGLSAEPDSTMRRLMNEPMSMLDWGVYRMEQHLAKHEEFMALRSTRVLPHKSGYSVTSHVEYDFSDNAINIKPMVHGIPDGTTEKQRKRICSEFIQRARGAFGYGEYAFSKGYISEFFKHAGYSVGEEFSDIEERIAKLVVIKTVTSNYPSKNHKSSELGVTWCVGSLLSDDVYFLEN